MNLKTGILFLIFCVALGGVIVILHPIVFEDHAVSVDQRLRVHLARLRAAEGAVVPGDGLADDDLDLGWRHAEFRRQIGERFLGDGIIGLGGGRRLLGLFGLAACHQKDSQNQGDEWAHTGATPSPLRWFLHRRATSTRKSPRPRGCITVSASVRMVRRRRRSISAPSPARL